jgi:hypothetical protein
VLFAGAFNCSAQLSGLNMRSNSIEHPSIREFREKVFRIAFSERMIKDG